MDIIICKIYTEICICTYKYLCLFYREFIVMSMLFLLKKRYS